MIDDCYLTIRKWIPNFIPDEAPIKVLTAWVRIPNLSVEYFDMQFLAKIGSKIGKVIRIDRNTPQAQRGKFTRLSVEIDLSKLLLSKFWLRWKIWRIQYDGIRMVCYTCGVFGHNEDDCPKLQPPIQCESVALNEKIQNINLSPAARLNKPEENEDCGNWMLVKKHVHKRLPRTDKQNGKIGSNGATETVRENTNNGSLKKSTTNIPVAEKGGLGSRFLVLNGQNEDSGERITE